MNRRALMQEIQNGTYGPVTPAQLDLVKAGEAITILQSLFPQEKDREIKARIARELVVLKVQDPAYWDYLVQIATPALQFDIPEIGVDDPSIPFPTPVVRDWLTQHPGFDFDAMSAVLSQQLSDLNPMASSGDPRSLPILRKALNSPNREVRDAAAGSLATGHDSASIPAVIALLHSAGPSAQRFLAQTLLSFEEPSATAAANAVRPPTNPLEEIRRGELSLWNIEQVVTAHQVEAIPLLKAEFPRSKEGGLKDKLASALIRFRDPDPVYWAYLYERARAVIESGAPPVFRPDADGKILGISPQFITWAKAHNVSTLTEDIMYHIPAPVIELAFTDDPRFIPLLREGLHSNYIAVPMISLNGLERVHAPGIIQYVVDECARNPSGATIMAMQLVEFDDDPAAAKAAAKFLSPEMLTELLKERASHPENLH